MSFRLSSPSFLSLAAIHEPLGRAIFRQRARSNTCSERHSSPQLCRRASIASSFVTSFIHCHLISPLFSPVWGPRDRDRTRRNRATGVALTRLPRSIARLVAVVICVEASGDRFRVRVWRWHRTRVGFTGGGGVGVEAVVVARFLLAGVGLVRCGGESSHCDA